MSDSFITLAIEQMDTTSFELWCQEVLANDKGYRFEPTGGMHDGGQDGFIRQVIGTPTHFIQISKEQNTRNKIRRTFRSLSKSRNVEKLTYLTSQSEAERDLVEAKLKQELGIEVVIHDQRWLMIQAKLHDHLKESLYGYSKELVDGLSKVQSSERKLDVSSRLSIVAYLEAHVRSIPGSENFQNICLDTLVYNSLVGTDPDAELFRNIDEIREHIEQGHPNVLSKAESTLGDRLQFLSSKQNDPRIRRHPANRYALPYTVRCAFNDENLRLENTSDRFLGSVNQRFNELNMSNANAIRPLVVSCVQDAVLKTYQTQAINFAASFSNRDFETDIRVHEIIQNLLDDFNVPSDLRETVSDATSIIFRHVCYSSNEEEREYLNLLMKFFTIQFVMDGDHAVTRYFSDMAASLRIYVGTDIIVRCLSEALVKEESRGMTNSLGLLTSAGVKLHVTRQTVQEVFAHIRHSTGIFRREYETWFRHATLEEAKNSDRILIRSFFYAFLEPERHVKAPRDWSDYLRNFGAAIWFSKTDDNTSEEYVDEFASFLIDKFELNFIEIDEVLAGIDDDLAEQIAAEIMSQRDVQTDGSRILAKNDAQMALFVNSERKTRSEHVSSNLYGYNTWWLTEETAVLKALRCHQQRDDVVMHPQFLMNHFILDPSFIRRNTEDGKKIMPTLFGLRITDRVPPSDMRDFLRGIGDMAGLDEHAQKARIRHAANTLKRGKTRVSIEKRG